MGGLGLTRISRVPHVCCERLSVCVDRILVLYCECILILSVTVFRGKPKNGFVFFVLVVFCGCFYVFCGFVEMLKKRLLPGFLKGVAVFLWCFVFVLCVLRCFICICICVF